jgi:hypothetical protein
MKTMMITTNRIHLKWEFYIILSHCLCLNDRLKVGSHDLPLEPIICITSNLNSWHFYVKCWNINCFTILANFSLGTFTIGVHKRNILPRKLLSNYYFEWPLHLQNNLFGRFSFFIRYSHTSWLNWWWFFVIWIIKRP